MSAANGTAWTGEKPRTGESATREKFSAQPNHRNPQMLLPPPHSAEAEMGVLGSCLLSRDAVGECTGKLTAEHFFIPAHQIVWNALVELFEAGTAIDLITFTQALRDRNVLGEIGGAVYVTSLFSFVPTAANVGYYIDIVRDKFSARQIIAKCTDLVRSAYEDTESIDELLSKTQETLIAVIIDREQADSIQHISKGMEAAIDELDRAFRHRGDEAVLGLATGFHDFDRMTTGLQSSQFVVIGARPSQGKTAFAMNIAEHMAIKNKVPVGVFSLEMSFHQLSRRLLSSHARVSRQRFRDGFLKKADFEQIPARAGEVSAAGLWIDATPSLTIASFRARARLMKVRFGVKVIVVDYLQLMRSTSRRAADNLRVEITEISAALKAAAKELDVVMIVAAQLNREAEGREFGKPKMADLRESGAIEQDADIIGLLWRPERHLESYKQREKLARELKLTMEPLLPDEQLIELYGRDKDDPLSETERKERDRQINEYAELIVAKQRDGPVGEVRLRFTADLTRFENVTKKMWSNNPEERQQ